MYSYSKFINVFIHITIHQSRSFMITKSLENWQYYLRLSGTYQRLTQNRNVWQRHKNMKRHTATGQFASRADLLAVAS